MGTWQETAERERNCSIDLHVALTTTPVACSWRRYSAGSGVQAHQMEGARSTAAAALQTSTKNFGRAPPGGPPHFRCSAQVGEGGGIEEGGKRALKQSRVVSECDFLSSDSHNNILFLKKFVSIRCNYL